jgi:N,N'-diacetylchitobiose transport system permease protein
VIIAYLVFVLPFSIWTLRGFVAAVPVDIEESALVDGCSRAGAFMKVLFPLIAPGLVATSIFAFIQAWNEYIYANVLLTNENATLPVWLASFVSAGGQIDWGGIMAGSTLFALPVVAFFLIIQRRVSAGMTAGAVKG